MELYSAFIESARKNAERTALTWEGGELSYSQLSQNSNALGHALKKRIPERCHIGLFAPNTPNFVFGLIGIHGAGHIVVPFSPLLNPEEIASLMRHSDINLLLFDPAMEEITKKAIELSGHDIELVSIVDLVKEGMTEASPLSPTTKADEVSMLLYTSGTTGNPKGVMLSHKNIYTNYLGFKQIINFNEHDTFIGCLPLHHTYAMTVNLYGALLTGSRLHLFIQFDPRKIVEAFLTEPNIIFAAVSPMLMMAARFAPDSAAANNNLRFAISGGGPLPDEVYYAFKKKYNHEILQGYGLTETSPVVAYNRPESIKVGTIGPPLPGVEVQVRDEQGVILGVNQIGELCVRGDLVMKGYYKNEAATNAAFYEEGWLRTGDMASIDEDGYLKIAGRLKDIILCGGENIYPQEIEDTLAKHPAVIESAVVAKPNILRQEVPHAFVLLAEQARDDVNESVLRKFCREHLGEYKIPDSFTFVDQMPRTAKGTIEKKALRQMLANEIKE